MEQQSKKTMRHFYCRDVLWETFEQMANDFDCSIDYLINEAMRSYARGKNYPASSGSSSQQVPAQVVSQALAQGAPAAPPIAPPRPAPRPQTTSMPTAAPPLAVAAPPPPPAPSVSRAPVLSPAISRPAMARPPSIPPSSRVTPEMMPATVIPTLYLVFNEERIAIDKDQFIIGRGTKSSDLPIKDGNISRKHAAVIRRNGIYYIKDLGSTNGIDYRGMRIDNKRIDEGDVFHICDYELRFTYLV